jgi:3,4-dihydroxy 2-butanone 4-phosphate synthase/GTP cyclohydrolase II
MAMQMICDKGGMVIYLFQEGRGIGLAAKIRAYFFQTMAGLDTVEVIRSVIR